MEIIESRNGYKIPVINNIPLHSKINPNREAASFAKDVKERNKVIVLGLGFGYHLVDLIDQSKILAVIEPDQQLINNYKTSKKDQSFNILTGDVEGVLKKLEASIQDLDVKNIIFKVHNPSIKIRPDLYQPYFQTIKHWLERRLLNIITDTAFGSLWANNCFQNLKQPMNAPLFKNLSNSPVIILGSGYSLINVIPTLKKFQDELIIIAIPPTLEILKKEGVVPDFVVLVDSGYANRFYLSDWNIPLITYLSSSHIFIKNWKGPVFFINSYLPLEDFLIHDFPTIPLSGSVANTVIELASFLSDHIYIAGFDFSFINGYYHYPGNPLEKELLFGTNRMNSFESSFNKLVNKGKPTYISSYDNQKLKTNVAMASYYKDFNNKVLSKTKGKFYVFTKETAYFPSVRYTDKLVNKKNKKNFYIQSVSFNMDFAEKLKELKAIYEKKDMNHPLLEIQFKKFVLKKQSYEDELKQTIKKIDALIHFVSKK